MTNPFRRWLEYWHGKGETHQYQFYRCLACRAIVTWKDINQGGCKCGASRISPTYPRFGERMRLLLIPWSV